MPTKRRLVCRADRLRAHCILLYVFTGLVLGTGMASSSQPEDVYLFDCGGMIQRISGSELAASNGLHVSGVDSSLPDHVRDGCSIRAGWYDSAAHRLTLVVQTQKWMDEYGNQETKQLTLMTPALVPVAGEARVLPGPRRPDGRAIWARLRSIESPFDHSVAYVLSDSSTLLLQELSSAASRPRPPIVPRLLWKHGAISLNRPDTDATGRYALLDFASGEQRGAIVSAIGAVEEHRVVCFTPSGRIFLAAARDTLLVLDAMDPACNSLVPVAVDLYWTACASH